MATAGQTIYNPVTHETITFLETPRDPETDALVFECTVSPGGAELAAHVHAAQEERFEIISGTLMAKIGKQEHVLEAGDTAVLPAQVPHRWWNAGGEDVTFRVEVQPARNLESTLEVLAALGQEGKLDRRGMPKNPFHLANIGRMSETYLPVVPVWMQKAGLAMGSATGRLLGYKPGFPEYVGADRPALEGALGDVA